MSIHWILLCTAVVHELRPRLNDTDDCVAVAVAVEVGVGLPLGGTLGIPLFF